MASYISIAAEKLRLQDSLAGTVTVFIHTNRHKETPQYYNQASIEMMTGSSDTSKLVKVAHQILEGIYREGFEYKKAGVILGNIHDHAQLNILEALENPHNKRLMEVMDQVNKKEGRGTLKLAACGLESKWQMARDFKSPSYTTRWSEIPKVR